MQHETISARKATVVAKRWVREQGDLPAGVYARFRGWAGDGKRLFEIGYSTRTGQFMRVLNLHVGADYVPVIVRDRRDRRLIPAQIESG